MVNAPSEAKPEVSSTVEIVKEESSARPIKAINPDSPQNIDKSLYERANALRGVNPAAAIALLSEELMANTELPDSAVLYASLLLDSRRYEQADLFLARYSMLQPGELRLQKLQVRSAMSQQKYSLALQLLQQFAVPVEQDEEFLELQAAVFQAQQNYASATAAYQQLLQYDSSRSRWWMALAVALDAQAQYPQARQAYQQALMLGDLTPQLNQYALQRLSQY